MKCFLLGSLFILICPFLPLQAAPAKIPQAQLKLGAYALEGSNPRSTEINYRGEVVIEQQGSNYKLSWKLDGGQTQYGVGILTDRILSVAYYQFYGSRQTGVVSFYVKDNGDLEGAWAGAESGVSGKEWLTFKGKK